MTTYHSKKEHALHQERIAAHEVAIEGWKALCTDLNDGHAENMRKWQDSLDTHHAEQDAKHEHHKHEHDHWKKSHADWKKNGHDGQAEPLEPEPPLEIPDHLEEVKPQQGELPPEPQPPESPAVYTMREIDAPTEIETRHGPALIIPPHVILSDGEFEFAVSPDELKRSYEVADE